MAEKPAKNLALHAFREQFSALYSALTSQPELVLRLASKFYKRALISQETRDAIQLTTSNTGYQAARLLAASESTIAMNPRILRQFPRILRKESTLKSVAEAMKEHYRALISEAGQVETSSSDSDSEIEYQREEADETKRSKSGQSDSEYTEHTPELGTCVRKETLPRVLNLLSPVLHSWDLFVQQIGVPTYKVSEIIAANANRGPNWLYTCFTQAMEWWVANYPSPLYEVIIAVLDPTMGQITPVMNRTLANEMRKFLATEWGEFVTEVGQAKSSDSESETEHTEHQEIGVLVTEADQAESSNTHSETEHTERQEIGVLISEAGQVETSSSDSDSEIEYQRKEADETKRSKSGHSDSEYTEHTPELGVVVEPNDGEISARASLLTKMNPALRLTGTCVRKETLPRVLNLLSPVLHSWDLFVQQIGVPTYKVSEIIAANANRGPNWLYTCFTQAMEWWVANYPSPLYEVIIAVLDPTMGQITPVMNRTLANDMRKFLATEWGEFVTEAGQAKSSDSESETEHTEHQEIGVLVTEAGRAESSNTHSETEHTEHQEIGVLVTEAVQAESSNTHSETEHTEHQEIVTSGDHESQAEERNVPEISFSDLKFGDKLEEGGFCKGHWQSKDMDVSIKRVPGKLHKEEIEILSQLNHPGVNQFYGVVVDNSGPEHYIVTEFAEGGSLYDLLHKKHHQPSPEQSLQWATDIAEGMNYLHQKKMMHRNLKSSNVLLTEGGDIKICDFGGAKCIGHATKQLQTGTYKWMAPEVMKGEPVSLSSDVFSYGMLLYEIFACKLPFSDAETDTEVISKIKSQEMPLIPTCIEPYLAALIRLCWDTDPKIRPSFEDILEILKTRGELSGQNRRFAELMRSTITQFQLQWRKIADLPLAVIRPHILHINNTTYCGGGGSGDLEADRKVFQYNNERDEWSALPLCPTTNHALVELNGNLISVGGIEHDAARNTPTNSVYVLEDLQWKKTMPPLAIPRFHASAITYDSHAIVCGGITSWTNHKQCTCTSIVEVYSSNTNQWVTSSPLPFALCRMSTAIVNDMCYVIGGAAQEGIDNVAACASLPVLTRSAEGQQASTSHPSPSSTMWEILPKCPCYGSTAAQLGGYILALGGVIPPSTADVHLYSHTSKCWRKITGAKLPVASYFATTTTLPSGDIILIGGAQKSDRHLNTVYIASIHSTSQ